MNGITDIFNIPEIPKIPKSTTTFEKKAKKNLGEEKKIISEKNFQFFFSLLKVRYEIPKIPGNTEIRDPKYQKFPENPENLKKKI